MSDYADIEQMDFIPRLFAEMLTVARATNAMFDVRLHASCSVYAPERSEVWFEVMQYRTGNRRGWWVDSDCWPDAVRQAKRMLSEWHETERCEPTTGCGVQGMW